MSIRTFIIFAGIFLFLTAGCVPPEDAREPEVPVSEIIAEETEEEYAELPSCEVTFPVVEKPASEYFVATSMEPSVTIYPAEVFLGDSVFLVHRMKNVGEKTGWTGAVPGIYDFQYNGQKYVITAEGIPGKYAPMWESASLGHYDYMYPEIWLKSGEIGVTSGVELELPPLEDWDTEFWRAVREEMPPEGRKLTITFRESYTVEILLKPRSEAEMKILEDWYRLTNHLYFPVERNLLYGYPVKGPQPREKLEVAPMLELGGQTFSPGSFIRFPHRKPPTDLAPKTLDEWRKLRDSFQKSTLRAELEFTVLVMEYYDAYLPDDPAPQLEKREKILRWILARPEVLQPWWAKRMMGRVPLGAGSSNEDSAERKSRGEDFLRALYPMLHPQNQKGARRNIPEMREEDERERVEWRIARGFTEEQKALGFRFWYDSDGKFLDSARLAAVGDDWVYLKLESGGSWTLPLARLSEADLKYVEEKQQDPDWVPDADHSIRSLHEKDAAKELERQKADGTLPDIPRGGKIVRTYSSVSGRPITKAIFSPNASDIFLDDGLPCIIRAEDGKLRFWMLSNRTPFTLAAAFSPDGRFLLVNNTVYNAADGTVFYTFTGRGGPVQSYPTSAAFSKDGRQLLTGHTSYHSFLRNVDTLGEAREIISPPKNPHYTDKIVYVAFLENETRVLSIRDWGWVTIQDISGEKTVEWPEKTKISGSGDYIFGNVTHSPDEKYIFLGGAGKVIFLYDLKTGKPEKRLIGHDEKVTCVAFSPDGKLLASAAEDKTIRLWDIDTGRCLKIMEGHTSPVRSVTFSPDGSRILSAGGEKVILWEY